VGCIVVVGEPRHFLEEGGTAVALTMRVALRWSLGSAWQQASEDERAKVWEKWGELQQAWKDDPGITYVCYFGAGGSDGFDGFSHHMILEVDDALKARQMGEALFWESGAPIQKSSVDIVWGNTDMDEPWAS
jgi:hypothetical protein